jgi:hypothetical protein
MNRIARIAATFVLATAGLSACIAQPPPDAAAPTQMYYPGAGPSSAYSIPATTPSGTASATAPAARTLQFNGHAATAQDLEILGQLEARWGVRLPDGAYWYDNASGAAGPWGGPMGGLVPAGLGLGGTLPAEASGGGGGNLTGVFVNGRELHPLDVSRLQAMVGQVYQGRWFVDAYGNFGQEGGMVLGNLIQIAQQSRKSGGGGGGDSYYRSDSNGSAFVGGGCVSVSTKSSPSVSTPDISYYSAGC